MSALAPGTRVNKYVLHGKIGEGGFGVTYLAWDETLGAKLAIKEYMPQDCAARAQDGVTVAPRTGCAEAFAQGMARFLNEARILARLDETPGIVGVRDYFEQNGTAYLVMRYIEGVTLRRFLKERGGRLPWDEALTLLLPAMEALAAVHAEGVVHRDISPDNLMVTPDGRVRLLDFGAARSAAGFATMSIILKPGYAPEEQYRSKGNQGPWTDVYAMGATLWRCVTGRVPPESLDRLAEDSLEPPSRLGAAIPPRAEAALMRALALRAPERIQNMPSLIAGLTGVPVSVPRAADDEPVTQPRGRPRPEHPAPPPSRPRPAASRPEAEAPSRKQPKAQNRKGPKAPQKQKGLKAPPKQKGLKPPQKQNGPKALKAVLTLALAFVMVIAVVGGVSLLSRVLKNPLAGMFPTGSPTASATPPVDPSAQAALPSATPDAALTPTPEQTLEPTPTPGEISTRAAEEFRPRGNWQWLLRYSDGSYGTVATRLIEDRVLAQMTCASDEFNALIGPRRLVYFVVRDGALWQVAGEDLQSSVMVLPASPQVGMSWRGPEGDTEIVAVNQQIGGHSGVILARVGPEGNPDILAYAPGRGLFARYEAATPEEVSEASRVILDITEGEVTRAAYEAIATLSLDYEDVR